MDAVTPVSKPSFSRYEFLQKTIGFFVGLVWTFIMVYLGISASRQAATSLSDRSLLLHIVIYFILELLLFISTVLLAKKYLILYIPHIAAGFIFETLVIGIYWIFIIGTLAYAYALHT